MYPLRGAQAGSGDGGNGMSHKHVYAGATGGEWCIRCGERRLEPIKDCIHSYTHTAEGWKCTLCGHLLRPHADETPA